MARINIMDIGNERKLTEKEMEMVTGGNSMLITMSMFYEDAKAASAEKKHAISDYIKALQFQTIYMKGITLSQYSLTQE